MHLQMKNKIGSTQADEDGFREIWTKTRGRTATFTIRVGRVKKKRSKVTSYIIRRAQIAANMSSRQVNKFMRHMRYAVG